jgi:hypothetical protein
MFLGLSKKLAMKKTFASFPFAALFITRSLDSFLLSASFVRRAY